MTHKTTDRHSYLLLTLVAVSLFGSTGLQASDGPGEILITELPARAKEGRFDVVLVVLKADPHHSLDPRAASLIRDLEHQQRTTAEHRAQRDEAYQNAMEQLESNIQDLKLHEALADALKAHDLAFDNEVMRQDPRVQRLINQSQAAAQQAEQNDDWVEAIGLYRSLDQLFDNLAPQLDASLKRAIQHVRVLRLYAPRRLHELVVARAQRRGDTDEIEPFQPDGETWQQRLTGAKRTILNEVLRHARQSHITQPSYRFLMQSAIDALLVLVNSRDALESTFDCFKAAEKVEPFDDFLVALRDHLKQRHKPLSQFDVSRIVDHIMDQNDETVALPEQVIIFEMAEGAMGALDDFTSVIWPYEKDPFSRNTKGRFFGVGIQISMRDKRLVVVSPLPDTPAFHAGIQAGDIIVKVNGQSTESWSLVKAVREITGSEGTIVTLHIERTGYHIEIEFPIRRARIEIESVRGWELESDGRGDWNFWIDRQDRIGYIRLSQFIPQTPLALDNAINRLEVAGPLSALILDLRFNPGGLLKSAIQVCDRFITHGPLVSTVGPKGISTGPIHRATKQNTHRPIPLVVLINQHSASGSEIVAGALQDYRRATIVGFRSFGKGSVQDVVELDHGNAFLKLTRQHYKLPLNRLIHRDPNATEWGIEPDLVIEMTQDQMAKAAEFRRNADVLRTENNAKGDEPPANADDILAKSLDPQLEAALLILKTQLVAEHLTLAKRSDPISIP